MDQSAQTQNKTKTIRWPDLSMYGMRLVVVRIPTGEWRLLMMGGDKQPQRLQRIGFRKTSGIWLRDSASITMGELSSVFKNVKVFDSIPEADVYRIMRPKARPADAVDQEELLANIASRMAMPIGINHLGQEVLIGPDGRFIRTSEGKVVTMSERGMTPAIFLRAESDEDLEHCADALVLQIDRGMVFRHEDIGIFATHIFDAPLSECAPKLNAMHDAINHALSRKMHAEVQDAGRNAFNLAIKLHEGLPPLTRELSEFITPLPVGVIAQRLAGATGESKIYSPSIGNGSMISSVPPGARIFSNDDAKQAIRNGVLFDMVGSGGVVGKDSEAGSLPNDSIIPGNLDANAIPEHDIFLANLPYSPLESETNAFGTKVFRQDHADIMESLSRRSKDGKSVFLLRSGDVPGEIDPDTKRLLTWISARFQVEGFAELDGSLFGDAATADNRYMVVIGESGQSRNIEFDRTEVMYDYEALWSWADNLVTRQQRLSEQPTRTENSYQAPYMSASRLGQPSSMIPRNLVGPVREALRKLEAEFGQIDEFVSSELQMPQDEMQEVFSPEQIDAIGLAIGAHKHGKGFIEADQTGLGKGRVLAAMARYAALNNMNTIFMSESSNLFSDFYRDIIDTHSEDILFPFMLNQGVPIIVDGKRIMPGNKSAAIKEVVEDRALPRDKNLLMTTYSQFNRDNRKGQDPKSEFLKEISKGSFLILDESHKAAGESNTNFNVLRAMRDISGVVYSSATYAKDSKNFRIYSKVMPPSVSPNAIPEILSKGGDPLAEVFSAMLAEDAVMIRREHDLSKLRFEPALDNRYAARNENYANKFAEILEGMGLYMGEVGQIINDRNNLIAQQFAKTQAAKAASGKAKPSERWYSANFGSSLYAVMRQFFLAIKADYAAELAIKALDEGRKPILTLESTNESLLREVVAKNQMARDVMGELLENESTPLDLAEGSGDGDDDPGFMDMMNDIMAGDQSESDEDADEEDVDRLDVPVTFRDIMHRMLNGMGRVGKVKNGKVVHVETLAFDEIDRYRQAIEMKIDAFPDLSVSPIDVIRQKIEDAGYTVGELSGRKIGITTRPNGDQVVTKIRSGNKNKLIDAYNNGMIDAMILSTAGATGISLHASEKFADQRQRDMIEVQIPNNVATRVQMFGRANRNGQVCWPIIRTVDSGLPSESRMISMQNAKLREMSANTTSNRENSIMDDQAIDLLNKVGSEIARKFLIENLDVARTIAMPEHELTDDAAKFKDSAWYANQLTGRLGMLYVEDQRRIYERLTEAYRNEIDLLTAKGENPFKSKEMDVKARIIKSEQIFEPVIKTGSVFDKPVVITDIEYDKPVNLMSSAALMEAIKAAQKEDFGNKNPVEVMRDIIAALEAREEKLYERSWNPKKYASLEDALNDPVSGAASLKTRLDIIKKWATSMVPGMGIQLSGLFGGVEEGIITRTYLPEEGREDMLGQYEVRVYSTTGDSFKISLYALFRDPNFNLFTDTTRILTAIDNGSTRTNLRTARILEGNIFTACEWSTTNGKGMSTIYTNEHGERCRGVILPWDVLNVEMKDAFSVDRDVAYALLRWHINNHADLIVSTAPMKRGNESKSRIDLVYHKNSAELNMILQKSTSSIQFIDASAITEVTAEQFQMVKGKRESSGKRIKVDLQNARTLIEEIYDANMSLFVGYEKRDIVKALYEDIQQRKLDSQKAMSAPRMV